jgi:outer membrane protein TolC
MRSETIFSLKSLAFSLRSLARSPRALLVLCAAVLCAGLFAAGAAAEGERAAYLPVAFSGEKIDLLEAVRLTLENEPNLLLKREDVRRQEGILQEVRGAFDWNLSAEASYQHEERELSQGVKDSEIERRRDLQRGNASSCAQATREEQKVTQLQLASQTSSGIRVPADPSIDAQLQLIERLIAETNDPVRLDALTRTRLNIIDAELAAARQAAAVARQVCVETGEDLVRLGTAPEFEEFDSARISLSLDKLFRNGLVLSPFLDATYDSTQYEGKRNGFRLPRLDANGNPIIDEFGFPRERFFNFGGKNLEDGYSVEIGFDVDLPLLRGAGRQSVAAQENSSQATLEAATLLVKHSASISVIDTVEAYWDLVAAQERLAVLGKTAARQQQLLDIAKELVEGDQLPRAELSRSEASLASARSQVEGAQRDLVSARLRLAQTIGLVADSAGKTPLAADRFPAGPESAAFTALDFGALAERAVGARFDVKAARQLISADLFLTEAARNDVRPRLDLSAGLWATANGEKELSEAVDRWKAPSYRLGLRFEHAFANNRQLGRLAQAESQQRSSQIESADLERNVRLGVVNSLGALEQALERLSLAKDSARFALQTIEDEVERLKLGESTLLDAILTAQQNTGSQLGLVAAEREVAVLLAQLRFETGSLIGSSGAAGGQVDLARLTTLPEGAP